MIISENGEDERGILPDDVIDMKMCRICLDDLDGDKK